MNPDLEGAIQAGGIVVTVYATSGDGGNPKGPWAAREGSVRAAHAGMAGVANIWSCGAATYAGKPTVKCTLTGKPSVRMVFLRLLDGFLNDLPIGKTVGTADGSTTYTGAQFTATLAAIQSEIQAQRVGTLDGTRAYGSDHEDHITSAFFAFDVARADGVARQITMYRGYSMYEPSFVGPPAPAPEAENLSAAQYQEKFRIIQLYEAPPLDDPFDQWCRRRYSISTSSGGPGPLHSGAGQCLQASGTDRWLRRGARRLQRQRGAELDGHDHQPGDQRRRQVSGAGRGRQFGGGEDLRCGRRSTMDPAGQRAGARSGRQVFDHVGRRCVCLHVRS